MMVMKSFFNYLRCKDILCFTEVNCFKRGANRCHIIRFDNIAPEAFARIGEPTSPNQGDTPLHPAKPIPDYQTLFSLPQLARELANGTPGQCEALARGAVSARYEVR